MNKKRINTTNTTANISIEEIECERKYNQLREEIIKAMPEIMELEFGCKIKGIGDVKELIYVGKSNEQHCLAYQRNGNDELLFVENVERKIIGRPITLEDCLIASKKPLAVTNYGLLLIKKDISANARYISSGISWKPNIPLQDQSDECKKLLFDLIVKKCI